MSFIKRIIPLEKGFFSFEFLHPKGPQLPQPPLEKPEGVKPHASVGRPLKVGTSVQTKRK